MLETEKAATQHKNLSEKFRIFCFFPKEMKIIELSLRMVSDVCLAKIILSTGGY